LSKDRFSSAALNMAFLSWVYVQWLLRALFSGCASLLLSVVSWGDLCCVFFLVEMVGARKNRCEKEVC